jgi:hypothetical protein
MRNLHMEEAGNGNSWKEQKNLFVSQGKIKKEKGKREKIRTMSCTIYIYIYILTYESTIINNKNFPFV